MSDQQYDQTIQKTQWTDSLLEDLCASLKSQRDDATVRDFAKELIDDKDLPIGYLVRKVKDNVGPAEAERLDILVRGRHAVEKDKAAKAKSDPAGGVKGLFKKFLK